MNKPSWSGLLLLLFIPVLSVADTCKGGGEQVFIKINAEYRQGESTASVDWPLMAAYADEERICVEKDDIPARYLSMPRPGQPVDALLVSGSDLVLAYPASDLETGWELALLGAADLPEFDEDELLKPSCLLQRLQAKTLESQEVTGQLVLSVKTKKMTAENCQGEKYLNKISTEGDWSFTVAVFALTDALQKDKNLGEKASWFFKSHPVDEDAKKRLKKR